MNLPIIQTNPDFDLFWSSYPKGHRGGKIAAQKAWKKLSPDQKDTEIILTALARQKTERLWRDGIGIPHASTYLNQARWTDEPVAEQKPQTNNGWSRTSEGVIAKGREIGLEAKIGETIGEFQRRIVAKLERRE